jgi:hypothetical protein
MKWYRNGPIAVYARILAAANTQKMLRAAHLSFTDVAQSFGSGVKVSGGSDELVRLRVRLADAEALARASHG